MSLCMHCIYIVSADPTFSSEVVCVGNIQPRSRFDAFAGTASDYSKGTGVTGTGTGTTAGAATGK